jgi:hypothetical protein
MARLNAAQPMQPEPSRAVVERPLPERTTFPGPAPVTSIPGIVPLRAARGGR